MAEPSLSPPPPAHGEGVLKRILRDPGVREWGPLGLTWSCASGQGGWMRARRECASAFADPRSGTHWGPLVHGSSLPHDPPTPEFAAVRLSSFSEGAPS